MVNHNMNNTPRTKAARFHHAGGGRLNSARTEAWRGRLGDEVDVRGDEGGEEVGMG